MELTQEKMSLCCKTWQNCRQKKWHHLIQNIYKESMEEKKHRKDSVKEKLQTNQSLRHRK